MTRDEQIEAALAILKPAEGEAEWYRREVAEALKRIDNYVAAFDLKPLPKRAVERHIAALERAVANAPLPDPEFKAFVEQRSAKLRKLAAPPPAWLDDPYDPKPPPQNAPWLDQLLYKHDQKKRRVAEPVKRPQRAVKRTPPRRSALRQKFAVIEAEGLLIHLGHADLVKLSRKGPRTHWHRLAAILHGDSIDLLNLMRASRSI